eukprot:3623802-Amphidinium_carterae.1
MTFRGSIGRGGSNGAKMLTLHKELGETRVSGMVQRLQADGLDRGWKAVAGEQAPTHSNAT